MTVKEIRSSEEAAWLCQHMNLPKSYWRVCKKFIPKSLLPLINKITTNYESELSKGLCLVFSGPSGIGKSSAAAYLAKFNAVFFRKLDHSFGTSFFTRTWELRENFKNKTMWKDNISFYEYCKGVDLLVLDDLTTEDALAKWPGLEIFTELLVYRCTDGKITIITTKLDATGIRDHFLRMTTPLQGHFIFMNVTGVSQKEKQQQELERSLL